MGKKLVTDVEIRQMHKKIKEGEDTLVVVKQYGITRQAYSLRLKKLNIKASPKTRKERIDGVDADNLINISDMYDLAALLHLTFDGVHEVSKNGKDIEAEIKRLNHLKNKSPKKFQEEVLIIILKHFKVGPLSLIKLLEAKED